MSPQGFDTTFVFVFEVLSCPPFFEKVFAWDTVNNDYDKDESDGRAYISAVSEIVTDDSEDCVGRAKKTMGEARMDIVKSEMGYLGFHDSESYGLTWKVGIN